MANTTPPDGVFVPVPTFFKESADSSSLQPAIDVPQQVAHSVHLAKSGITGLVLMGSTGEAIHMSRQERVDMISGVRKGLDEAGYKDYPIMAGVLVNSVDETLEWLDDSAKAGAQWGLVLAPGYFGGAASQDNLVEWYTLVADKSPLPILIYNYPGVTNNLVVSIDTYAKLAAHPKIVGCKMSHGNVSHHVQVSLHPKIDHSKFRVYSGFGQQLGPIVVFNAAGVIDGLAAIYPKTITKLFKLASQRPADEETQEEVRRLQWKVSSAEEFIVKNGILGIREAIFKVLGFGHLKGGRLPLKGTLAQGVWEEWSDILGQMADEEKSL
ncbi:L-threo-3-deoxy-hexylosonate aldolase like protein [Verticillium longisporum]|uniref:Dihydrodipicolinate synthase n=3 Tax=Verticillium TaxID=1036719 RepID=G2XI00_VERDV|nr:dihydrodipicolinate synthase [Verticillium dahliae VdLs.17]KAF3351751.1 26S proteasome non-ATPase regulatory subunit 10 [Verticillium dahliae VDG2]KAF3353380.1 Pre-mRNA-processing factor 39 [Verticillium dahliae VDG1]KAG7107675.1 L-threo-3-deoxy-hexylosonate aldolase like protein [Verticillium longisporum]KAH6708663.1 dihydrodipicolinate synthase [Verticillium dahliae]EGY19448.1 dihydrodipicolinate synthase [Verticillium dahliae VdLs.17]